MSSITTNVTQCTIETLNQYNGFVDKNVDQQNNRSKPINNCDGPIDSFTGRGTELSDLSSKFNKHNIVVVHGVGGVGKTQLARKFAAVNKNNYNCLFWLQAEFQENLIQQLRELALELDIKGGMKRNLKQIRNEIYEILKSQRALLIFDNILNEADIIEYLPPVVTELKNTKLHILITSQFLDWNKKTVEYLQLVHLEEFYALELLTKILNHELNANLANAKDKKILVHLLDYMPLAIQIAASYINTQMKQNDAFTITHYIEKLTNGIANIHKYKNIEYGKTLGMSIKMSLDIIRKDNAYAMELVYIMAFFNPDSITKEILSKILKVNNKNTQDDFCEALAIIVNYSLISSFDNRIYLHRNIQNIIRDDLTQLETFIFLKYYKLVLDYVLKNEDQNSIRNTYVFKYAKEYTQFITQCYTESKSAKLLQLLCEHGCLRNLEVIFAQLNEVNFLIEQHGLLHCSTLSSDIETVKIICKYNIDVNMKYGTDNTTSLHIACKHGHVDITDFLIDKGADTNIKCENGRMPLHYASSGLHYDIVCRLLRISPNNVEKRDDKNQTPLHLVLNTHKTNENNNKTVEIARLLIENGADPDTANDDSYKVIHIAAHNGDYDFLAYLLDNFYLDVNVLDKHGNTPLLYTICTGTLIPEDHIKNIMKLLIKNGADIETINNDGISFLHAAAELCHYKNISYLIKEHNISVDTRDSSGRTPLHCALLASKQIPDDDVMATVKLLIKNGADVETISNHGYNLLHVASECYRNEIISYLIQEHNISLNTVEVLGRTPIFYALFADRSISEDDVMVTLKLLIEYGADVEAITNAGCSILHIAASNCHYKIISYLIQEHNISVDTPDYSGQTPLLYALNAKESISEDEVMATVKLLIENGADVKTISNSGCSLLHMAAESGHDKIISYLIQEYNISVDTTNASGRTPLFCAMLASKSVPENDVMATVKLLIEHGADVETISNGGYNLLHAASENCHHKVISYLIQEHKISIHKTNSDGNTPLLRTLVADKSIPEDDVMATVNLLIENGASVETINNEGSGLLHIASQFCHYKIISYLIQEHNLSVDKPDSSGRTPLFYALLADKSIFEDDVMATVKLLIENEANAETITNDGTSLLHVAARYCHYKIISYLIQEHNISVVTPDDFGQTPLHLAMFASKSIPEDDVLATVKLLIENGADVETISNDGSSLLHVAAQYCHYKIISYLIQGHNIPIDTPSNNGETPLLCVMCASKSIPEDDVMATVKLLIENGADVERINSGGCSLLHAASQNCYYKIISYLLQEHNIFVDMPQPAGQTPLFCAMLAKKSIPEDDVMATVKLLIEHGADVETITKDGHNLLHVASENCHHKVISYLIEEHKISIHKTDSEGSTPLFRALFANKSIPEADVMTTVKLLIANGASVETITKDGYNILHVASQYCHYKIISYLIQEHNISVDTPNNKGETPLFRAMFANKSIPEDDVMATVKLLIANGASVETITKDGYNLLHVASENCHHKVISYLIQEHKISIHKTDNDGSTPLLRTLTANKSIPEDDVMATVKLLIANGASVETITNGGCSLLQIAAKFCHYKIISYLIQEHNISLDTPDKDGETPLFYAMLASKSIPEDDVIATVKLLIGNGASVETITNIGCSLLHFAAKNCNYKIISYLIQEHNISVDPPDSFGQTPLFYSLVANKSIPDVDVMATVKLLIKAEANVETINNYGLSLLHVAAQYCHYKIMSYLIQEHNISVNAPDSLGQTPLFYAMLASKSIPDVDVMATVKLLIENEANVGTITNDGRSLLHVAAENGHYKIISYLIQEHSISVHTPNNYGENPLFAALLAPKSVSEDDSEKTIKVLIEMGAQVDILDDKGNCLLHKTVNKDFRKMIIYLFNNQKFIPLLHALLSIELTHEDLVKMIDPLVEERVHMGTTDNNGTDLLHVAARYGRHKIILHLIQKYDLPVTRTDSLGHNPLFCALKAYKFVPEEDVTETIKLLIAQGATVEATDNRGCTILHYAAQYGRYQALTYLLHNYNINIDSKDEDGHTPLHYALIADESINQETVKKIIEILLVKGASINLKNNNDQNALDLASAEVREFILKSYADASKGRMPEITQQ